MGIKYAKLGLSAMIGLVMILMSRRLCLVIRIYIYMYTE